MRVLVFGAGAVGSVAAVLLSARHEVAVAVRGERGERIAREGITITGAVERTVRTGTRPEGRYDLILVTTKAYDTAAAAEAVAPFAGEDTAVVSLQNGLGNLELLEGRFGDRAVAALTTMGATRTDDTTVKLVARGRTVVGSTGRPDRARAVAAVLKEAGLDGVVAEDIRGEIWMKAVVNAAINPLAALAGGDNGRLLEHPPILRLSEKACGEAVQAARATGVALPAADPFARVKEVVWSTRNNRCSMLQDLEAGRRTEIDEITGEVVRRGEAAGVPMTVNRSLWALMRAAEGRREDPGAQ